MELEINSILSKLRKYFTKPFSQYYFSHESSQEKEQLLQKKTINLGILEKLLNDPYIFPNKVFIVQSEHRLVKGILSVAYS